MWSNIVLLAVLVGAVFASSNPAWRSNTKYVYEIHARTLSGFYEVSKDYTGLMIRGKLVVEPKGETLYAKIEEPEYASIHWELNDPNEHVPSEKLDYKPLQLSRNPFKIVLENGVVTDLMVSRDLNSWEANIIKGIVSQIQLDTKAKNLIQSEYNNLPQEEKYSAEYKTLEETVTGKTETLYNINEFPEYLLQTKPWYAPLPNLKGNGKLMEVVKTKNYTKSPERPMYHYGWDGLGQIKPGANQMGQIIGRTSVSRAIISGTWNRYTIQHCHTTNVIMVSPTLYDKEKATVYSMVNITLESVQSGSGEVQEPPNAVSVGLIYSHKLHKHQGQLYQETQGEQGGRRHNERRLRPRSLDDNEMYNEQGWEGAAYESFKDSAEEYYGEPDLTTPHSSPLLPFNMGFFGKGVETSGQYDMVQKAKQLANEISQDLNQPEQIIAKDTGTKFVLLTTLTRSMSQEQIQTVANSLYRRDNEGRGKVAWEVFRDAVAECGTGPAFLAIEDWILTQKIKHTEAADVIVVAAGAARQPTVQYMKKFFELLKNRIVKDQYELNTTAILAFSTLCNKVYVNLQESHAMYPVHTYGKFRTQEGKRFLKEEVIPYMGEELKHAIQEADSVKIQTYIRALGHIGDEKILEVFKPYLEGKIQVSQFQRFMMVISFDNLVESRPKLARAVLFRIYQNRGDTQEVRVAAVYQLMRTSPPAEMLQKMAMDTNIDSNEQVNAAIQSAIKTASKLQGDKFINLRQAAKSAKPFLTKKQYGLQYSKDYLHSYVVEQMNFWYKHVVQTINDGTSFWPKGGEYSLHAQIGGYKEHRYIFASYVSSVKELVHEWQRKCQRHRQQETESNQQGGEESISEKIARLLNMEIKELEQLEGNVHIKAGTFHKFFAYSNETLNNVPRWIREIEEALRNGKQFRYTKIVNQHEKAVAYPVEMGVPFIFTYDLPTIAVVEGQVRGSANPQIATEEYLNVPESIETNWELDATLVRKVRGKIGFMSPFTKTLYSAGYDKNVFVRIPIKAKVAVDFKHHEIIKKFELEPKQQQTRAKVFHYSSIPYVASSDILSIEPTSLRQTTKKLCNKDKLHNTEFTLGEKSTGMPFKFEMQTSHKLNLAHLYEKFYKHQTVFGMMSFGLDENVECNKVNVYYRGDRATSQKMNLQLRFKKTYISQAEPQQQQSGQQYGDINQLSQIPHEAQARQQEFITKTSRGIQNAHVRIFDASVSFDGSPNLKYNFVSSYAYSGVDPKSRAFIYYRGHYDNQPQQLAVVLNGHFPNTNGLNMEYAMQFDPTSTVQIQAAYGKDFSTSTRVSATVELRQTEERKNYLKNTYNYQVCREQMARGNYQQRACANMTQEANLLDHIKAQVQYSQVSPAVLTFVYKVFDHIKYMNHYYMHHKIGEDTGVQAGHLWIEGQFRKDLKTLNVTLKSEKHIHAIRDLPISDWCKRVLVIHPTFNMKTRLIGKTLGLETYRPICSIGKDAVVTFDNVTYQLEPFVGTPSYLMFQYVQPSARNHYQGEQETAAQHIKHQTEKYAMLIRESQAGPAYKQAKIIVNTPYTEHKTVQIELEPIRGRRRCTGSSPCAKITVDGQEIHYNDQRAKELFQGYIEIYALPNGEAKVKIDHTFYVIYDGMNLKLTTANDKLRGSIKGLCGDFNGEKTDDIRSPKGCILRNMKDFFAEWAIIEAGQNQEIQQAKQRAARSDRCIYKKVYYANVISRGDYEGGQGGQGWEGGNGGECSTRRTHYEIEGNTICFTIQPIKVCKPGCQVGETISRDLPVHCVQKSNVANLWRQQIDEGSSPDFSRKAPTKSIRTEVPVVCRR